MRHQDQTVLHAPPDSFGDCFRTTVANLLGLPAEDVPHFLYDGCDMQAAIRRANEFLRQFGLAYIQIASDRQFLRSIAVEGLYHEGCGRTERNTDHSAAFCDGQLEHDPHPSHAGFTSVAQELGIFVALRPWEVVVKSGGAL